MWQKVLLGPYFVNVCALRLCPTRPFATSQFFCLNQKWRKERGLPMNPNSGGVLTDGPDYSFLDGRPTPYNPGQLKRLIKQQQIAEQIIKLSGEVDFAVERHIRIQREESERKQKILDSKLKPKGIELLKKMK